MNRISQTLSEKKSILSIYFTAGYPKLEDTNIIIKELQNCGVDMIEIGLPFSDPLADGPTIQNSSQSALTNGMNTEILFQQLKDIRATISIPLIIMGYFNPILQYGVDLFCNKCREVGIDGLIIPDLPLREYKLHYKELFIKNDLANIFLVTPQTSEDRIRIIDQESDGFIYLVSSAGITGSTKNVSKEQLSYFERISKMNLTNPLIVGFGINDNKSFDNAVKYTNGAIIGSAFINSLTKDGITGIKAFIGSIRKF